MKESNIMIMIKTQKKKIKETNGNCLLLKFKNNFHFFLKKKKFKKKQIFYLKWKNILFVISLPQLLDPEKRKNILKILKICVYLMASFENFLDFFR